MRKEKKFRAKFSLAAWLLIKVGKLERVGILGQAFQIRVNCPSIWECFGALNLIACLLVIACKLPRDGETDMRMWVARAELVHDWRRTEKGAGCIQEVSTSSWLACPFNRINKLNIVWFYLDNMLMDNQL